MRARALFSVLLACCSSEDGVPLHTGPSDPKDADAAMGDAAVADAGASEECPRLESPVASPGDPIDGDSWETFAHEFFSSYCTRCHSSTLAAEERNGAPLGADWDREEAVRDRLDTIRLWVGQFNAMPVGDPKPSCDERRRLVRWIDADAP